MSSISLYMATVMFVSDWPDVTDGEVSSLFPYGERDPYADGNARRAVSEDPC
jgi:hypothetical protein